MVISVLCSMYVCLLLNAYKGRDIISETSKIPDVVLLVITIFVFLVVFI